ncbi:acyltransferase-like protein [Stackebrandtia endophytica]|uniref:Acyltransferase-like protein n=1 Tax=Stackebrandtia endophytica TaxID=1496996 RepID=A0A543B2P2_9ACTN|nr:acyltransferase [Stackebrandtia endophytica]TQL79076.1 acyltransferase-like protein [Stackebrandtia endophytica]
MRDLIERVEAATPARRDRGIDALRALAVAGVVVGHWLVTALVADSGAIAVNSPLRYFPELAGMSWLFQTLAVFFLVGGRVAVTGYESARAAGVGYRRWLAGRLGRLARPVAAVLLVWLIVVVAMLASGVGLPTTRALAKLVISPLWFLAVFVVLTALTPLAARINPLWPLGVVVGVDVARFGLDAPEAIGFVNVVAAWLIPYCLGAAWAKYGPPSRSRQWLLVLGGVAATVALIGWADYPVAMVGVPGAEMSNLNPPSLAIVTFGLAQCGLALLLLPLLRRAARRPAIWTGIAVTNLSTMTVFCWHQTAMITVSAVGLLTGGILPGLHTPPDGPDWILTRLLWLPVFALVLLVFCLLFRHRENRVDLRPDPALTPTGV